MKQMNFPNNYIVLKYDHLKNLPVIPSLIIQYDNYFYYIYYINDKIKYHWKIDETKLEIPDDNLIRVIKETNIIYSESQLLKLKELSKWEDYISNTPDPLATEIIASTILGNLLENGKAWLIVMGEANTGKDWLVERFNSLEKDNYIHYVGKFTPAIFSTRQEEGILKKIKKGGTIIFKDFNLFFGLGSGNFLRCIYFLKELYDGSYEEFYRNKIYRWAGKVGVIICARPKIYREKRFVYNISNKFINYRLDNQGYITKEVDMGEYILNDCIERIIGKDGQILNINHFQYPKEIDDLALLIYITKNPSLVNIKSQYGYYINPGLYIGIINSLKTISAGMSIFENENQITKEILKKIKKIAINTALQRYEPILKSIFLDKTLDIKKIKRKYPYKTSNFVISFKELEDIGLIRIGEKEVEVEKAFENIYNL